MATVRDPFEAAVSLAVLTADLEPAGQAFVDSCGRFFSAMIGLALREAAKLPVDQAQQNAAFDALLADLKTTYAGFEKSEKEAGRGVDPVFTHIYSDLHRFANGVKRRHLRVAALDALHNLKARMG